MVGFWIILILLVCLLFFFLGGVYAKRKFEKEYIQYQERIVNQQIEEVNQVYLTMRGWRHDYHNHMQKLKAHLAMGQTAEMEAYLNMLEGDLDKIDIKYRTGNVNLDAILNSKLSMAEKFSVEVDCKTEITTDIAVSDTDLCALIGNLIDNGLEACEKMKKDRKFIRIYICIRKQQLYISVINSTNEVIRKLDREYVTNKRGNHGHGLKRIDAIVEKYRGYIKRSNEPGVFATEIMLPL